MFHVTHTPSHRHSRSLGERLHCELLSSVPCAFCSGASSLSAPDPTPVQTFHQINSNSLVSSPYRDPTIQATTAPLSPSSASSRQNPSTTHIDSFTVGKSSPPRKSSSDIVTMLVRGVKRETPWLVEARNDPVSVLSRKVRSPEDRRLQDIRDVEGDSTAGNKEKLLRLLAVRSLALEFTHEQDQNAAQTRVEELTNSVLSLSSNPEIDFSQKGNRSDVSEFVNRHSRFTSKSLTRRSIHNGIKHGLIVEEDRWGGTTVGSRSVRAAEVSGGWGIL